MSFTNRPRATTPPRAAFVAPRLARVESRARDSRTSGSPRDEATARARRRAATRDRPGIPTSESSRLSASRRRSESDIDIARPAVADKPS